MLSLHIVRLAVASTVLLKCKVRRVVQKHGWLERGLPEYNCVGYLPPSTYIGPH